MREGKLATDRQNGRGKVDERTEMDEDKLKMSKVMIGCDVEWVN